MAEHTDTERLNRLQEENMPMEIDVYNFRDQKESRAFLTIDITPEESIRFVGRDVREMLDQFIEDKHERQTKRRRVPNAEEHAAITKALEIKLELELREALNQYFDAAILEREINGGVTVTRGDNEHIADYFLRCSRLAKATS